MKAKKFFSNLSAITNSGHFTPYANGVIISLSSGETATIKIKKTFRSVRPLGLRLSKFAFVTEVTLGDFLGIGYREDDSKLLAIQKSIAEGVERVIFHSVKNTPHGTSNSNGWAAHLDRERAFSGALDELLERDAVLVHWLCNEPMAELNPEFWPKWLQVWCAEELPQGSRFKKLRILLSNRGHLPTATTLLLDQDGFAVLSHATASSLETAIYKALVETCRIGQMALENISVESSMKLKDPSSLTTANLSTTRDILRRWGYNVDTASNGDDAIETVRGSHKDYAVALLDYKMPGKNGAEVAQEIRKLNDDIVIIMYSAYPSVESLRATIRAGSVNFIEKTEDLNYLRTAISDACAEFERFRKSKPILTDDAVRKLISSIGMVGVAEAMARVAEKVHKFRPGNKPALILGETGSGKEMIAKALHNGKDDNFFVVNCAAFQNSGLVESELFGHEKGAFTGATSRKVGILEAARGGTVYLDELHYLDMQTQGKLLRAIREKKIRRVGGVREESVDFRLVASSWPNIEERVAKGTFLPDLYYRLKFLCIEIPPLRDRPPEWDYVMS